MRDRFTINALLSQTSPHKLLAEKSYGWLDGMISMTKALPDTGRDEDSEPPHESDQE